METEVSNVEWIFLAVAVAVTIPLILLCIWIVRELKREARDPK